MKKYPFTINYDGEYRVKTIEHIVIPMSDGTRLAAKIWRPDVEDKAFPAILEMIPYRKRDVESWLDSVTHPYFAARGYACVRVDLRGSGDSEGVLEDEYLPQEQQDGLEVLKWIAAQEWCDGNIGMMGISWGGFNGLQFAALQPPELKTIITLCSTDDRYADDVHYMGGCLLGDNLSWASVMFAYNSCPPDPELVGSKWREIWMERLGGSGLWLDKWLRHPHRDEYWKHGSVCEDYSKINIPVYAVSGWADGYSNAVFRMVKNLPGPSKGVVGPWSHKYPHVGVPGPAIGFLQDALRWWDKWLKGKDTGVQKDPALTVWMQDSIEPVAGYKHRPGRWVQEEKWPSANIKTETLWITDYRLIREGENPRADEDSLTIQSPLSVGMFAGKWCSYSSTPDLPHDQREEDGGALVFESFALKETIEILGAPEVELSFKVDKPVAQVIVRLSNVAGDDKATRITYGMLNLTHRESHESPEPLEPGKTYRVRIRMNEIAQQFPKGHRIRLSVSNSYWPMVWPAPESFRLTIIPSESKLHLPVKAATEQKENLNPFGPPEGAEPLEKTQLEPGKHNWFVKRDLANDTGTLEVIKDEGVQRFEHHGMEMEDRVFERYSYQGDDLNSVRGEVKATRGFRRGHWHVRTITRTLLRSTPEYFLLDAELNAYEGEVKVFSKVWNKKIERKLV